jgi:hypothetical protein
LGVLLLSGLAGIRSILREHSFNPIFAVCSHFRSFGEDVGEIGIGIEIVCDGSLWDRVDQAVPGLNANNIPQE